MQPKGPTRAHNRTNVLPPFDQLVPQADAAKPANSAFNTGFREWLRKITSTATESSSLACEQIRLEHVKKLIGDLLGAHVESMSRRDLSLYLRMVSASQINTIREARFECFDLMCRTISEQMAVRKIQELDALMG
jgi:hypothetical protein